MKTKYLKKIREKCYYFHEPEYTVFINKKTLERFYVDRKKGGFHDVAQWLGIIGIYLSINRDRNLSVIKRNSESIKYLKSKNIDHAPH